MVDLHFLTAVQLSEKITNKDISCLELLDLFLTRVEKFNPTLNAIIYLDREAARDRARLADEALTKGESWGPLHGVPMTVKENFDIAGQPSTWGVPNLKNNIAKITDDPKNQNLRLSMLISSYLSGISISKANTTLCHSISYPINKRNKKFLNI